MDDRLLVRIYNVGLGDFIYLRVPDKDEHVHIVIDCGNKFSELNLLGQHFKELQQELPTAPSGMKRLDLLVVTHPHEDHHKGFEEEFIQGIEIKRLWLSPAYKPDDTKSQGLRALQNAAFRGLQALEVEALGGLKELVGEVLGLSKKQAVDTLNIKLPESMGIDPQYVSADTPDDELQIFQDPEIKLKVLAPMEDIDAFYLGGEGLPNAVGGMSSESLATGYDELFLLPGTKELLRPGNISSQDFTLLRRRTHANALALAELTGHVTNNLSVVLLLEWNEHRLLFPGDAEWKSAFEGKVMSGRTNGSWNVMWRERQAELSDPLDFLKIGHHGSDNATPWTVKDHPMNTILDHLLPLPEEESAPTAVAIASTERTKRWPSIPDPDLMTEIGKRVANATAEYVEDPERTHVPDKVLQPQRTDLEAQLTSTPEVPVPFIEVEFPLH